MSTGVRTAVVTGAASGIGKASVERLLELGWSVAGFDRDEAGLASLVEANRSHVVSRVTDIADSADVADAFSYAHDSLGPIDAVVAAAGVWTPGAVDELSDDQWAWALSINLTGMFNTARAGVRQMLTSGGGAFVAVASDVGVQGSQNCASYVVAKHGVVGLVRSMALDFGHRGIRTNAICPGFVETAMTEEIFREATPELLKARNNEVPIGRFAKPSEVAAIIGSVIEPEFSFMNGAALLIDGGATAGYYTPLSHS